MNTVAVSVIVPSHDAGAFLGDALQSVRDQTLSDFECIVVDDASSDDSCPIARGFAQADPRFRLIVLDRRQGASASRNFGIAEASGTWVALLDADDLFLPDRLERLVALGEQEGADLVFDDQWITEYPVARSTQRAFGFNRASFAFSQLDFFNGSRLFRRSFPVGYMKPLMRRDYLRLSGASYDPNVPSGEDFLFFAQLFAASPRCFATSYAGYVYRRRRGSLSRSDDHLHQHAELGDRVLREFGAELSPASRAALEGRRRDFQRVAAATPAFAALRERAWGRLARLLIRNPRMAATGFRQLATRSVRAWSARRGY